MRFNLHLTHWSLMFITLISSCFLFYVVASENAKYVTTKHVRDASMASNDHKPPTLASTLSSASSTSEPTTTISSTLQTTSDAATAATDEQANLEYEILSEENNVKILPNYKKVKKLVLPQTQVETSPSSTSTTTTDTPLPPIDTDIMPDIALSSESHVVPSSSMPSIETNVAGGIEGSIVSANNDYDDDDDLKKSSDSDDSVLIDNNNSNNDNDRNSDVNVENKNVFNTIEELNSNENANSNIHSSIELETQDTVVTQQSHQVPDVKQPEGAEQGIKSKHVQDDKAEKANGLPDITDIPTVTVTELPLEVLQPPQNSLDAVIIADGNERSPEEKVNRTIEVITDSSKEEIQKDEQIVKLNDSGGGGAIESTQQSVTNSAPLPTSDIVEEHEAPASLANNIPTETYDINHTQPTMNITLEQQQQQQQQQQQNTSSTTATDSQMNLTAAAAVAEEVPMPVFSEWAQKQMEAAEKQQALEQEQTVNNSAQRKNNTNGNGKPAALKLRAKNYASPDCGAKIIASSVYTSNAGAVLSSSKDEYMLSLCGNRIWFVVELCEAIQAQKIDFANFELYSSSPQNFTVAVSKRFPTREWSNVGRFEAEDKRAVQSFDLHPHLFGKFVRVDINSHYSKEHYCTLSLFRVFGTSEFEAFETENHPNEDLDDFDDEYLLEQNTVKHAESNLFKSASDAVLSIVKKATEVLGKPASNQNQTFKTQPQSVVCRTPVSGLFNCADCPATLVEKVNNVLTCEFSQLNVLLNNKGIRNDLLNTRVCAKLYGIETKQVLMPLRDMKQSFYVNILPNEYLGALCHVLAIPKEKPNTSFTQDATQNEATEMPTNLTMDKKFDKEDLNLLDHPENKLLKPEVPTFPVDPKKPPLEHIETSTEVNIDDNRQQLPRPLEPEDLAETTTLTPITKNIQKPTLPDTNIFNVPADDVSSETEIPVASIETPTSSESIEQTTVNTTPPPAIIVTTSTPSAYIETTTTAANAKSEEDTNSWDNIEHLLTTVPSTVASPTGSPGSSVPYSQQKISNGGPQSESVFIRLSNRIKALERNMSLSGQYLEELSRRYKKQVEELQQTLTQQMQTVRTLEEQNRRHHELEQMYALRNSQLKDELDDLTLQVHAFIVVIIFVGAFVFLVLMVGILFYRSLRRETKEVLALYEQGGKKRNETSTVVVGSTQKKLNRRKSFEDYSDHHQQSITRGGQDGSSVNRRPSEEAMLILKDFDKTEELDPSVVNHNNSATGTTTRQRKISVCYSSNSNINQTSNAALPPLPPKSIFKRKGEKHSWPNSAHAQMQAWQHLEELNSGDRIGDSPDINPIRSKKSPSVVNGKTKKKKDSQGIKRQQSSPVELSFQLNSSAPGDLKGADYNERHMLDEDDLDNFIPNTDLAYNEFMPDGPRGYQCLNTPSANANNPALKKSTNKQTDNSSNLKKSARRLSSPVFFKSPFTKSLKGKITNSKSSSPAHESTSWEWYRLKKSASSASSSNGGGGGGTTTATNNAYMRVSPNASLDSSSLSEINFPTNSTENSFRILEEAILSSGESAITTVTTNSSNCKKSTDGISSGSNSNRSSSSNSSTQSKKKNRSFNKIFRKVF